MIHLAKLLWYIDNIGNYVQKHINYLNTETHKTPSEFSFSKLLISIDAKLKNITNVLKGNATQQETTAQAIAELLALVHLQSDQIKLLEITANQSISTAKQLSLLEQEINPLRSQINTQQIALNTVNAKIATLETTIASNTKRIKILEDTTVKIKL